MKRGDSKALVAMVDTLIRQTLTQLDTLNGELSPYSSPQEKLAASKLAARYLEDLRRLVRLKSELLDSRMRCFAPHPNVSTDAKRIS